jgi:hypothetical protein
MDTTRYELTAGRRVNINGAEFAEGQTVAVIETSVPVSGLISAFRNGHVITQPRVTSHDAVQPAAEVAATTEVDGDAPDESAESEPDSETESETDGETPAAGQRDKMRNKRKRN